MKKLMSFVAPVVLAGALSSTAFAQVWSQPVREMEKPARSAVYGTCYAAIPAGGNATTTDCSMYLLSGNLLSVVPEGKVLVLESASATCTIPSAAPFRQVNVGWSSHRMNIPAITQGTNSAYNYMVGTQLLKVYVPAGQTVKFGVAYYSDYNASANCGATLQGHLVSLQ